MKLSRSYVSGLGSGLILSALIAILLPFGNIHFGETSGTIKNQDTAQSKSSDSSSNIVIPPEEKPIVGKSTTEKAAEEKPVISGSGSANTNQKSIELGDKGTLIIPAGTSADKIADLLLSERWITSKEGFLTLVKERNLASKFKAGSFELTRTMGIEEIVSQLIK